TWQIDAWWTRLVQSRKSHFNDPDPDTQFYGAYAAYVGATRWGYDLYALGVERNGRANPNGRYGTDHRVTLGGRFWTKDISPWDFEAEGAWQVGRFAGDRVSAWMAGVELGYTFIDCRFKPRVWVGYEFASGDESPNDGKVGTFNQLFPLGHAWFGYIDVVGRQNIHDLRTGVDFQVVKNVKAGIHFHNFWLAEDRDALYNAGGAPLRRDPTGSAGSYVGSEIDVVVKVKIDRHSDVLIGYSHFFAGSFVGGTGPDDDVDFAYVQYQFTF
ncbi:MAG: alginate export family protein, partial [Planctomycetota bacterium]